MGGLGHLTCWPGCEAPPCEDYYSSVLPLSEGAAAAEKCAKPVFFPLGLMMGSERGGGWRGGAWLCVGVHTHSHRSVCECVST